MLQWLEIHYQLAFPFFKELERRLARNLKSGKWSIHQVKPKDKAKLRHDVYDIFFLVYNEKDEIEKHW